MENTTIESYNVTKVSEFINLPKNKRIIINGQPSIIASGNNSTIDLVLMCDYYNNFNVYSFEDALNHLEIEREYKKLQKLADINKYINTVNDVAQLCSVDDVFYYGIGIDTDFEISIEFYNNDEYATAYIYRKISYCDKRANGSYVEDVDAISFKLKRNGELLLDYNEYKKLYHSYMDDNDRHKLNIFMKDLAKALSLKIELYKANCSKALKTFE